MKMKRKIIFPFVSNEILYKFIDLDNYVDENWNEVQKFIKWTIINGIGSKAVLINPFRF